LHSYLRFSFVSSYNTKAADEKKEVEKIAVVTVDTVKKKAINIIDTIDYNKRMQALSNNDTRKVAGKMAYPLPGALLPYNRIIAFTEIYIPQGWES
jgi:hypothetical protein